MRGRDEMSRLSERERERETSVPAPRCHDTELRKQVAAETDTVMLG